MAATNVFSPGQPGGSGNVEGLYLKKFTGDVLLRYRRMNKTEGLGIAVRRMNGVGQSQAQFIVSGDRTAAYHVRGQNILEDGSYLGETPYAEITCQIDRPLIAASLIDDMDRAMAHWDFTSEDRFQAAKRISNTLDERRLTMVARGASRNTAGSGNMGLFLAGTKPVDTVVNSNAFNSAATFESALGTLQVAFDTNDIPETGRYLFVSPTTFNLMVRELDEYIDRDFAGEGSKPAGEIKRILGWNVVKTNSLAAVAADVTTNPTGFANGATTNDYRHLGNGLMALAAGMGCIGEVTMGGTGFKTEGGRVPEYLGTLLNTMYIGGFKELRPEACGAVYSNTVANRNPA